MKRPKNNSLTRYIIRRRLVMSAAAVLVALAILVSFIKPVHKTVMAPNAKQSTVASPQPTPYQSRLKGRELFVYTENYVALEQSNVGNPAAREVLNKISRQPIAEWFGDWNTNTQAEVDRYIGAANQSDLLPVLVTYNIPGRDCGNYSSGGAASSGAYSAWIQAVARGIGTRPAVIVMEPDATSQTSCLSSAERLERIQLLRESITVLKQLPQTRVYLDAGNAGWIDPAIMAKTLEEAGIDQADGFSVNVANYYTDAESSTYADSLLSALNPSYDLSYVIDTSRNGNGRANNGQWCNPAGRLLGRAPSLDTSRNRLDAYLWIKKPGASDGTCNGGPPAGQWWLPQALELAI